VPLGGKRLMVLWLLLLVGLSIAAQSVKHGPPAPLPPRVIGVEPRAGAADVEAGPTSLRFLFDRPVGPTGITITDVPGCGDFPAAKACIIEASFEPGRQACTVPVLLKPGRVYALGLGSPTGGTPCSDDNMPTAPFAWAFATGAAPEELPPTVAALTPANGATDVDPALEAIEVAFDRPMDRDSWLLARLPGLGRMPCREEDVPLFDEAGTHCRIPVRLAPDTNYAIYLNAPGSAGFRDQAARPSVPCSWVFRTATR
jgi:hypothetical protein